MLHPIEIVPGIFLSSLKHSSSSDYYYLLNHPKITPFIPHQCVPDSIDKALLELKGLQSMRQKGSGLYWGLYKGSLLVGTCGLHTLNSEARTIEVSYEVHPDYWGRGIASGAVTHLVHQAPLFFDIDHIHCFTLVDNIPSQKVAIKSGFTQREIRAKDCYFNGKLVDRILFVFDL